MCALRGYKPKWKKRLDLRDVPVLLPKQKSSFPFTLADLKAVKKKLHDMPLPRNYPSPFKPVQLTPEMVVAYAAQDSAKKIKKYLGPLAKIAKGIIAQGPKRIRSRRPETAKQDREYNARVKVWLMLPENIYCHCCIARGLTPKCSTNVHHRHGRGWRRELLMVEALWVACCNACHPLWLDAHREEARALGLLAPKGQWNQLPPELRGYE